MTNRNERLIQYLGLGYTEFVEDQIKWGEIYYKEFAKDLRNKASSQRMHVDLNAYIGEILAFYLEDRFRNSNLVTANNINSIVNWAPTMGYKFGGPTAASDSQPFYLEVPATTGSTGEYIPDLRYAINYKDVQLQNTNGIVFEALEDVDFKQVNLSSSLNYRTSDRDSSGVPTWFVIKQTAKVMAGKTITETFTIADYEPLRKILIGTKNVLQIIDVKSTDGEKWEEVNYLAQDVVFEAVRNYAADSEDVPYVLKMKSAPRRFVTEVDPKTGITSLTFGNGKASDIGRSIVPDPAQVAIDLKGKLTFAPAFVDPQDFLKSRNLGLAPYGTTLTVRARVGGGKVTNTAANSLNSVISKVPDFSSSGLDVAKVNRVLNSFTTRNLNSIQGGDDAPTIPELKSLISANFAAQGRVNTREDYIVRIMSMPSIFGKVFRVSPVGNCSGNTGVQIYLLAKNDMGHIVTCSETMKKNIKQYLSLTTRMRQGIDLLDGKVINIGVEYTVVVAPGYNKSKVKLETLLKVKEHFKIDNWQPNQAIFLDEIRCAIKDVEGVVAISDFKIFNKSNIVNGLQYSTQVYDVGGNTRNNIIFCVPNSIFEVKFPDADIKVGAL